MTFDLTNPFHVGYIVADVEIAMEQLSAATGVTWHPPQVFALTSPWATIEWISM